MRKLVPHLVEQIKQLLLQNMFSRTHPVCVIAVEYHGAVEKLHEKTYHFSDFTQFGNRAELMDILGLPRMASAGLYRSHPRYRNLYYLVIGGNNWRQAVQEFKLENEGVRKSLVAKTAEVYFNLDVDEALAVGHEHNAVIFCLCILCFLDT